MIGFTPPLECMQFDCENTDTEPATLAVPIFPSILFMDRGGKAVVRAQAAWQDSRLDDNSQA